MSAGCESPAPLLILASASPRRQELLRQFGVAFDVLAANVDESVGGYMPPAELVMELARRKALAAVSGIGAGSGAANAGTTGTVGGQYGVGTAGAAGGHCEDSGAGTPGAVYPRRGIVIGADTVVVTDGGDILGKPADGGDARRMLRTLGGAWHEVYTGVALADIDIGPRGGILRSECARFSRTRVKMRPLDDGLILRYIETGEPADKAGAYAIQGFGSLLVERIEGCFYNVVGLPLALLGEMLAERGVSLL